MTYIKIVLKYTHIKGDLWNIYLSTKDGIYNSMFEDNFNKMLTAADLNCVLRRIQFLHNLSNISVGI